MSTNTPVAVMDQMTQNLAGERTVQSALAHALSEAPEGSRPAYENTPGSSVTLEEAPVTGLLVLRAGRSASVLSDAMNMQLKMTLPDRLQSQQTNRCCIRWMSPDEWLLSCPLDECYAIEQALRAAVPAEQLVAIVNVSGGYSVLRLSGSDAVNVLKKSMAYDIHPDHFSIGKVVNTTMAKTQVTLRALPEQAYELVVRRSYADYAWLWLQRAGSEYGLQTLNRGSQEACSLL